MTPAILQTSGLTKEFVLGWRRRFTVLREVNFEVDRGEVVSFIGVNGAGKTTLLKLLTGLVRPTRGQITVAGLPVSDPRARRQVGFSPENPFFYPGVSGRQWLHFTGELYRYSRPKLAAVIARQLKAVNLERAADRPLGTYSKGMRARLAFAQAALTDPAILLLDEPLDGLDPVGRHELKALLLAAKKRGTAIIICSHILSDLEDVSDRIGVIHRRTIHDLQPTRRFIGRAGSLERAFINHLRHVAAG